MFSRVVLSPPSNGGALPGWPLGEPSSAIRVHGGRRSSPGPQRDVIRPYDKTGPADLRQFMISGGVIERRALRMQKRSTFDHSLRRPVVPRLRCVAGCRTEKLFRLRVAPGRKPIAQATGTFKERRDREDYAISDGKQHPAESRRADAAARELRCTGCERRQHNRE